jgi:hypothetical protein
VEGRIPERFDGQRSVVENQNHRPRQANWWPNSIRGEEHLI